MKGYQTACKRLGVVALVGVLLAGCSENDRPLESPVRFEGGIFGTYYQITLVDPLTQGEANALEEAYWPRWKTLTKRCRPTVTIQN